MELKDAIRRAKDEFVGKVKPRGFSSMEFEDDVVNIFYYEVTSYWDIFKDVTLRMDIYTNDKFTNSVIVRNRTS